jgi:hypothetical protein
MPSKCSVLCALCSVLCACAHGCCCYEQTNKKSLFSLYFFLNILVICFASSIRRSVDQAVLCERYGLDSDICRVTDFGSTDEVFAVYQKYASNASGDNKGKKRGVGESAAAAAGSGNISQRAKLSTRLIQAAVEEEEEDFERTLADYFSASATDASSTKTSSKSKERQSKIQALLAPVVVTNGYDEDKILQERRSFVKLSTNKKPRMSKAQAEQHNARVLNRRILKSDDVDQQQQQQQEEEEEEVGGSGGGGGGGGGGDKDSDEDSMESEDSEERKNRKRRKMEKKLAKRNARAAAAAAAPTAAIGEVITVSSTNNTTDDCDKGSVTEPMDEVTSGEGVGQRQEHELEQGQGHVDSAPTVKAAAGQKNSPPSDVPAAACQHYGNEVIDLCDSDDDDDDDDDDDVIHIDDDDDDEDGDDDGLLDSGNKVNKNNKSTNGKGAGDSEGELEADILENFNSASKKNATEEHKNFFGNFRPSPAVNSSDKNSTDPKKGKAAGRPKGTVSKSNAVKKIGFSEETIAADLLDKQKQRAAKAYKHFTDENGKISC